MKKKGITLPPSRFENLDAWGSEIMKHLARDLRPNDRLMAVVAFSLVLDPLTTESHWQTTQAVDPELRLTGARGKITTIQVYQDVIAAAQRIIDSIQRGEQPA